MSSIKATMNWSKVVFTYTKKFLSKEFQPLSLSRLEAKMNKAQVFIRLHRPSTGSSLTVPATMNQEIDIEMALGLQELLINSGFVAEQRYYTEEQLKNEHNFEYVYELDEN
jgi:hypothetical protein